LGHQDIPLNEWFKACDHFGQVGRSPEAQRTAIANLPLVIKASHRV